MPSISSKIDPEYTAMVRDNNKKAFGFQSVKILHDKPRNGAIRYYENKNRKAWLYDDIIDFDKKFHR